MIIIHADITGFAIQVIYLYTECFHPVTYKTHKITYLPSILDFQVNVPFKLFPVGACKWVVPTIILSAEPTSSSANKTPLLHSLSSKYPNLNE